MPRFFTERTRKISVDALKDALRDLDGIRIFSSPSEASRVAELRREIRSRIAPSEGAPEAVIANIDRAGAFQSRPRSGYEGTIGERDSDFLLRTQRSKS